MIIAANFKTNFTRVKTAAYINDLDAEIKANNYNQEVYIFPPSTALDSFDTSLHVGAQNAYGVDNGAFTGEIALEQLEEFQIDTILIGHSERRHVLGETQEEIVAKFNFYKEKGFKIIYCIGEPLEIRESGSEIMTRYVLDQFDGIDVNYEKLVVAYEPVWAIGTGLTPTSQDIIDIHTKIKETCSKPLLYGGSVKVTNVKEILELDNVDGVLVGGASLYMDHFLTMIETAENLTK